MRSEKRKKIKNVRLNLLFWFCPLMLYGETHIDWIEARSVGMGGCGLALSSQHNPSSLLFTERGVRLTASYENRYMLRQFSTYNLGLHCGVFPLQMGGQFSRFGYENYNETACRVYGACRLNSWIGFAVRVQYAHLYYSREEGGDNFLSSDMFLTLLPSERWCIGVGGYALAKAKLNSLANTSLLPFSFGVGVSYLLSKEVILCFQSEWQEGETLRIRGGAEYVAYEKFAFRVGFSSEPLQPTFGVGFRIFNSFRVDLAASYHRTLGFSPTIGGMYCF